ncbi:outer membrane protein assembly factor BamB family protein [Oceanirhabdus sp. W0125-5]|uniref:outer membrane protein assembly factor BamB family protein n=1 Tax=Oceanirhabdus sp. W0125-5 TaxID=2999116 RepID=UPI0022F2D296|nr:PQQ-binding-like beta-propeller repeat protein [Oceanirhabdus sp. W0125-5]WBW98152.1 PQQ-binding-like beta-propeller repeat protein [Oceanirhabdus sp. W0125-5]
MINNISQFDNNEGVGGFKNGAYDKYAVHPTDINWTRQSRFAIPDNPKLLWKVTEENSYVDETIVSGSFVVDRENNILVSDCDNNIFGEHFGRIIKVSNSGDKKEVFKTDMRLKPSVISKSGLIYLTTTNDFESENDKLFCLYPDGTIRWEFPLNQSPHSKPVLDEEENVYLFTYSNEVGTLYSISSNGILNWKCEFDSINWYEPIISKDGIIYIGLNNHHTLCAFNKMGHKLWERKLGQGLGSYPPTIKNDGTIYARLSRKLLALDSEGNVLWTYTPKEGNVVTSPAIDMEGNLYLNLSNFRLVSLDSSGKERWITKVSGGVRVPPIIGKCKKIIQQSFMQNYPHYKSWIEVFSEKGEKIWTYELNGVIISSVLGKDNLIYILSNCHTFRKKGWKDKKIVKWELYSLGEE